MNSTHPKPLTVRDVCVTRDYSNLNQPSRNNYTHLRLVFQSHKVVNVDDKKKEITVDILMILLWKDKRMKAFFTPPNDYIELPPMTSEYPTEIWHPASGIVIPNMRNRRYLLEPIVALSVLQSAKSISTMYENISFSGNCPVVKSYIYWSITVSCPFNFLDFPFDTNNCPFVLTLINMNVSIGIPKNTNDGMIKQNITDGFEIRIKQMDPTIAAFIDNVRFTDVTLSINFKRQVPKYIYQYYIPCFTIVVASSFSFVIPLSAIPGRVALVVTQFLTLTNIFINQMVSINAFRFQLQSLIPFF